MADPTTTYERCIEAAGIALASGDHPNAERALRAAIESIDGVDDSQLELAAAFIKFGTLKQELGSHAEAEELFRRALEIGERALGPDHIGLVPALKGLGATRVFQGAPEGAEPSLTRALAISERHLGEDHPDLVILLNDLTRLYLKQSAHAFAEPLLQRLLEMKRSKGEDHPEVATVLASLAAVRQALGRHEAAEQLWRRVLSIREHTLAPNHFALATALEHLAETCAARGKIREGLQLFQRALTIREATLGRDHPSLRASRERIADLELQASEEVYDVGGELSAPAPMERLLSIEELSLSIVPSPREKSALAPTRDISLPVAQAARPLDRILAPTATGLVMTAIKSTPGSGQYLDTLLDIKDELGESVIAETTLSDERGAMKLVRSVGAFLMQHRAAAIIGISAITLPLAAWGVAGATRSNQLKFVDNKLAVVAPVKTEQSGAALPDAARAADSAAKTAPTKSDKGARAGDANEELQVSMPTTPAVVVRIDSVRGVGAPFATTNESVLRHLASSADLRAGSLAPAGAPVRARLIGALPTPRYPTQQIRGRTGGEVRVRFDVDTTGRPVMSTFTVVGAPLPQLANAVKQVIPGIRFEPARTPWPENRPMVETVELAFQFALPSGK